MILIEKIPKRTLHIATCYNPSFRKENFKPELVFIDSGKQPCP